MWSIPPSISASMSHSSPKTIFPHLSKFSTNLHSVNPCSTTPCLSQSQEQCRSRYWWKKRRKKGKYRSTSTSCRTCACKTSWGRWLPRYTSTTRAKTTNNLSSSAMWCSNIWPPSKFSYRELQHKREKCTSGAQISSAMPTSIELPSKNDFSCMPSQPKRKASLRQ